MRRPSLHHLLAELQARLASPGAGGWRGRLAGWGAAPLRAEAADPALLTLRGAWCLPLADSPASQGGGLHRTGGLLTAEGQAVPLSGLHTSGREVLGSRPATGAEQAAAQHLPGRSLYLGLCHYHFGHFLAETASRLWPFGPGELARFDHLLLLPLNGSVPTFVQAFFEALGVADRWRVVDRPLRLDEVCVPGPAVNYPSQVSRAISRLSTAWPGPREASDERVLVLSREALLPGHTRVVVGAQAVEQALAAEGARLFCPEQHDLPTQVATLRAHRRIVGYAGSALHTLMLAGGPRELLAYSARPVPAVFPLIDDALGVRSRYIQAAPPRLAGLVHQATGFRPEIIDPRPVLAALRQRGWLAAGHAPAAPGAEAVGRFNTAAWLRLLLEQGPGTSTPPPAQADADLLRRAWMGSAPLRQALRRWQATLPGGADWPELDAS